MDRSLVVWDFDLSLFSSATTDYFVLEHFSKQIYKEELKRDGHWTDMMSRALKRLHNECGVTKEQISAAFCEIEFSNAKIVKRLSEKTNVAQIIVSDANDFFISTILEHHKLESCFDMIATNPTTTMQNGSLHVNYYHNNTLCKLCPKNLCKGQVELFL
jgi:pyridoxal phosphate phosphatase PHOSPHO2